MTSIFKDDTAKQTMLDWYERFRARLTVPTDSRQVPTRFGDVCGRRDRVRKGSGYG